MSILWGETKCMSGITLKMIFRHPFWSVVNTPNPKYYIIMASDGISQFHWGISLRNCI